MGFIIKYIILFFILINQTWGFEILDKNIIIKIFAQAELLKPENIVTGSLVCKQLSEAISWHKNNVIKYAKNMHKILELKNRGTEYPQAFILMSNSQMALRKILLKSVSLSNSNPVKALEILKLLDENGENIADENQFPIIDVIMNIQSMNQKLNTGILKVISYILKAPNAMITENYLKKIRRIPHVYIVMEGNRLNIEYEHKKADNISRFLDDEQLDIWNKEIAPLLSL